MQIEHIREFLSVARIESITETAKRLYITQSALSRHITALEEEVGSKLFERLTHRVKLTEAGEAFRDYAETIVSTYGAAMEHLSQLKNRSTPVLRIGYLHNASKRFTPKIMDALGDGADEPTVQFEAMEHGRLLSSFMEKSIDVGVTLDIGIPDEDTLCFVPIAEDEYHAVVPFGHPFAERESITIGELTETEDLLFPDEKTMTEMRRFFMQAISDSGASAREKKSYRDIPSLAFMVEHNEGVSMMLAHHAHQYGEDFAFVPIADMDARCRVGIMWDIRSEKLIPGKWADTLRELRKKRLTEDFRPAA